MFTMHHIVSPAKTLLKSMLGKTSIVSDVLRTMRTSAACKFRYQIEMENQILHEIMEKNPNYSETVVPAPKEFRIPYDPQLNHNTFSTFYELTEKNLQERQHLGNGKFSNISNALSKSFPSASYEEIVNTLHCLCFWPETPTTYEPNFKRIWNSLDHECAKRMEQWNVPQKLLIADYWYHLSLSRISVYNQNMIKHLSREKSKLRNIDFVQLFFFINLQRSVPQGLFDSLESRLPSLMDKPVILSRGFKTMSGKSFHMVFLYGTLRIGEPNHFELIEKNEGHYEYLGKARTLKRWPLVIASRFNIPYLLYAEDRGEHVIGDLYRVDDFVLCQLDELECHPTYYERTLEEVELLSQTENIKANVYFFKKFKPELLDLPFLKDYSSSGPHGLKYVDRETRPNVDYYSDVMTEKPQNCY